ncbi:efflux RND transporter permease subunit [Phenylobacterium sp.]|uniref:efflux RND transporter permease subunit n=1 Tax=Phenylobacterium sp. TaxID=1871053 RepID=UPI00286BB6B0|nr:efflux RND transporter permease subunit [Phenylobacterium sp.]
MKFDIAAFSVRNWQFTLVAFGLLVMLGVNALLTTPRSEDPHFPIPIVTVRAVLPGAEPAEMEQLVADPLEDVLDGLDDVNDISSTSLDGAAVVVVEFDWSVNPERKYDEVVREVNALRPNLPQGLSRLEVRRARTTEVAIVQVALVSEHMPMRRLEKLADTLRERLDRAPGVREARYWGTAPSEVRVALDLGRLAALQLPATAVADALRAAGAETPIGAAHAGDRRFNIKTGGAFRDLEVVANTPVRSQDGQVVRVRDVATVSWEQQEASHLARFNGARAVFVTVAQKDGADVATVTKGVQAALAEFKKTLPAGVRLEEGFVQADNVQHRLSGLFRDFGLALAIVMITLLPLGFRAAGVVMLSIPLSLLIGLAMLQALGFTVNQLAIAGFVLSLGLLVDDSIVVTENIARHLRAGGGRVDAAIAGTRQITLAVIGCTATLMFAFLPLLALPGGSGGYIRSLPVTVLCTVGASLVVALTIIPFLASRMLSRHEDPEGNAILRGVNGVIHRFYTPVLHRALARPWAAFAIIAAICATTVPLLGLIGSSLFPPADTPQFLVRIETADGTALAKTDAALRFVERRLKAEPKVVWMAANLGRGNPQIFYNQQQRETQTNYAEVFAALKSWEPGESPRVLDRLRTDLSRYPGARISLVTFENGPPIEAPVAVRITGENLDVLKALAARAERALKATPGTRDVENPLRIDRTDLDLGVDDAKAAALGAQAGAVRRVARLALSGEETARFRDPDGDDYPVRVRLPMAGRNEIASLADLYVPTQAGQSAPLSALAQPSFRSSPARITRYDRERTVTVTSQIRTGYLTSKVTTEAQARLARDLALPPGYHLSLGGQAEAQSESFAGLGAAILVAIFGILAVLVLEFGKFRTALVVAGVIPLGLFGAVAALAITGNSLSFTATIGLIALIGIEIKNSILLVDFTEQLRKGGMGLREAIEKAGEVRFLPVLLTSVTAIGGLLPLALEGSGLYSPLAIAIIGGLITSTFLSRVATPVTYLLLSRGEEKNLVDVGEIGVEAQAA